MLEDPSANIIDSTACHNSVDTHIYDTTSAPSSGCAIPPWRDGCLRDAGLVDPQVAEAAPGCHTEPGRVTDASEGRALYKEPLHLVLDGSITSYLDAFRF